MFKVLKMFIEGLTGGDFGTKTINYIKFNALAGSGSAPLRGMQEAGKSKRDGGREQWISGKGGKQKGR